MRRPVGTEARFRPFFLSGGMLCGRHAAHRVPRMPKGPSPTAIDHLLDQDVSLSPIVHGVEAVARTEQLVRSHFPPDLASQIYAGPVRGSELILIAPTSVIASRIRLSAPAIVSSLQSEGILVRAVRAKVVPGFSIPPQSPPAGPTQLSPMARRKLLELAKDLKGHPDLRKAVTKLANVGRPAPPKRQKRPS